MSVLMWLLWPVACGCLIMARRRIMSIGELEQQSADLRKQSAAIAMKPQA